MNNVKLNNGKLLFKGICSGGYGAGAEGIALA
jgi:hypothetical protein